MASISLYPPVVNNTEPAFEVKPSGDDNRGELKIYFNFSAFSEDIFDEITQELKENINVHVKLVNKNNVKVINDVDGDTINDGTVLNTYRLRRANVILNLKPIKEENSNKNLYYIVIKNEDVKNTWKEYIDGWYPGWIYKVQLRLSNVFCTYEPNQGAQEAWMFQNQDNFSEWSPIIYAKAIPSMILKLNNFKDNPDGTNPFIPDPSVNPFVPPTYPDGKFPSVISGTLSPGEIAQRLPKEYYSSYRIKLWYFNNGTIPSMDPTAKPDALNMELFEDSGDVFAEPDDLEKISYTIKRKLKNVNTTYALDFSYITINGYSNSVYYYFNYQRNNVGESSLEVYTAEGEIPDNNNNNNIIGITPSFSNNANNIENFHHTHSINALSIGADEEAGRISFKIRYNGNVRFSVYANNDVIYYCIKRASMLDGFQEWTPIYYGYLPPIDNIYQYDEYTETKYDYTAESGVYYKYGIEELDKDGNITRERYPLNPSDGADTGYVMRIFEHSYLLGENNQQLKIMFDPSVQSYGTTVSESKIETIGGQFPRVSRNTAVYYKSFPISSVIASQSDEEGIFFNKEKYYDREDWNSEATPKAKFEIANRYDAYAKKHGLLNRDFVLERDFRKEVIKFLTDGKPKLFKSTSEGNIIVRLMDINTIPIQNLSRLVSSFSANAYEIDEYNMENCLKYGFYNPRSLSDIEIAVENG